MTTANRHHNPFARLRNARRDALVATRNALAAIAVKFSKTADREADGPTQTSFYESVKCVRQPRLHRRADITASIRDQRVQQLLATKCGG